MTFRERAEERQLFSWSIIQRDHFGDVLLQRCNCGWRHKKLKLSLLFVVSSMYQTEQTLCPTPTPLKKKKNGVTNKTKSKCTWSKLSFCSTKSTMLSMVKHLGVFRKIAKGVFFFLVRLNNLESTVTVQIFFFFFSPCIKQTQVEKKPQTTTNPVRHSDANKNMKRQQKQEVVRQEMVVMGSRMRRRGLTESQPSGWPWV